MLDNSRKLILTKHAKQRAEEFNITINKIYWSFWHSENEPNPPGVKKYYDNGENDEVLYRRNGTLVMTVRETTNKFTGEPAYLMITMYDQNMDASAKSLPIE